MALTWARRPAFGKRPALCLALLTLLAVWGAAAPSPPAQAQAGLTPVPGGSGLWLPPAPALAGDDPLRLAAPAATAVLIYNHGSRSEDRRDLCRPLSGEGSTTPGVLRDLSGTRVAGRQLAVFAFCTETTIGGFRQDGRGGTPKLAGRQADIARLLQAFRDAGHPPELLFLAGHSAGGFASLLIERDDPQGQNAVIAFAPAFAGRRGTRSPPWQELRRSYLNRLAQAPRIDALVYAFESDPYNRPRDLAFLLDVPGVTLIEQASLREDDGEVGCGFDDPHRTVFRDCFAETQQPRLLRYLAERLPPGGPAP